MGWFGFRAPFAPLHPANTFATDHVGPRAGHGDLFLPAVKINQHLAFRSFAADFMVEVDQQLIVALHEIDFDTLDAPLGVLLESGDQLIVERLPDYPKNDAHVFFFGVSSQLLHIDFGNDVEHIPKLVPAFVQNDVLDAIFGGEVDVILVGLGVDSGLKIHIVNVVEVPPVPRDLAWLDP